ncbi:MAG: HD domain-containing protein [Candidatus Omnitrophica bacterium]|nr:HD domain-containing protein [Candidatus Omnitrophota bacterium]
MFERRPKKINYQTVLRDVARSMVRLKRPERLLKLITRYIDRELGLSHTSLVVLEETRDRFIFVDSKGSRRVPIGLIKFEMNHPLVLWFRAEKGKELKCEDFLQRSLLAKGLANGRLKMLVPERRQLYEKVKKAMDDLKIELAIPGYFKRTLIGLLLLGEKKDRKPFTKSEISFFQTLTQDCSMAVKTAEYHRSLIDKNVELERQLKEIHNLRKKEQETYYEIMRSLAQEVHAKDPLTYGHINDVEYLGLKTAEELGLDLTGRKRDILSAGLILHDVGKIGIPDQVLKKPTGLSGEEREIMKTHVDKGVKILEPLTNFKEVIEIVRTHHENFDGSGYPLGLKGDAIPIEARIVSVVDAFHAIVTSRCYRSNRSVELAFDELKKCSGTQFDPQVVDALIRMVHKEKVRRGSGFFNLFTPS